jgi:hypothetical protein
MRWKVTHASVTGRAHTDHGEPGQDFSRAGTIQISDEEFFIGLAADGAGSTTEGGHGAQIACDTLYQKITGAVSNTGDISRITDQNIREWLEECRLAIAAESQKNGKRLKDYACTVLGSVAGSNHSVYFQIGDGAIVTYSGKEYQTVFWPEQGEYANTTFFITDEHYHGHLHILHADSAEEIALFTDGLQNLVLLFSQKKAHQGFFQPLFESLRRDPGIEFPGFSSRLEAFLCREDINARSDDDKTLVLAVQTR